jgi:hypothetical protein
MIVGVVLLSVWLFWWVRLLGGGRLRSLECLIAKFQIVLGVVALIV